MTIVAVNTNDNGLAATSGAPCQDAANEGRLRVDFARANPFARKQINRDIHQTTHDGGACQSACPIYSGAGGAGGVQTRKRISRANFPRAIWLWLGSILGSILGFWPRPSTAAPWGRRGTLSHTLLVVVSSLRAWNAKTVHPRSFNFSPLCRSQLPLVAAFDSEPVPQPNWLRETDPQKHYIAS